MQPKITKELQDCLIDNTKIETVYFKEDGSHCFNAFELPISKNSEETDLYRTGKFSHKQVIPGKWNVEKMKEDVSIGDPSERIFSQMSREEVLDYHVDEIGNELVDQIKAMSPNKQKSILAALGLPENIGELLAGFAKSQEEETTFNPAGSK